MSMEMSHTFWFDVPAGSVLDSLHTYAINQEEEKAADLNEASVPEPSAFFDPGPQILAPAPYRILNNPMSEKSPSIHPSRWRALIVEDNPFNQQVLVKMLGKLEVDCEVASNISEARSILDHSQFTHLLTDVHLPDGFGDQFAEAVRQGDALIRIYLVTADIYIEQKLGENAFINGILFKPYSLDSLRKALEI